MGAAKAFGMSANGSVLDPSVAPLDGTPPASSGV